MGKIKETLDQDCFVIRYHQLTRPFEASDFNFKGGNFVPLWHAAKVANTRLTSLVTELQRLQAIIAQNESNGPK
jgi:hypothetical protein